MAVAVVSSPPASISDARSAARHEQAPLPDIDAPATPTDPIRDPAVDLQETMMEVVNAPAFERMVQDPHAIARNSISAMETAWRVAAVRAVTDRGSVSDRDRITALDDAVSATRKAWPHLARSGQANAQLLRRIEGAVALMREHRGRLVGLSAHEAATAFYRTQLYTDRGRDALTYLTKRGLEQLAEADTPFAAGYAPGKRRALIDHLTAAARGFTPAELAAVGLAGRDEETGEYYDRFRDRVMLPIRDEQGRTVAFAGRMTREGKPKWLNSPESDLYHKHKLLFGFGEQASKITEDATIVLVEGYFDAIAISGIEGYVGFAVATNKATRAHLDLLEGLPARDLIVALDADEAGRRGTESTYALLLEKLGPQAARLRALTWSAKDAAEIHEAGGKLALREALEAPTTPLAQLVLRHRLRALAERGRLDGTVDLVQASRYLLPDALETADACPELAEPLLGELRAWIDAKAHGSIVDIVLRELRPDSPHSQTAHFADEIDELEGQAATVPPEDNSPAAAAAPGQELDAFGMPRLRPTMSISQYNAALLPQAQSEPSRSALQTDQAPPTLDSATDSGGDSMADTVNPEQATAGAPTTAGVGEDPDWPPLGGAPAEPHDQPAPRTSYADRIRAVQRSQAEQQEAKAAAGGQAQPQASMGPNSSPSPGNPDRYASRVQVQSGSQPESSPPAEQRREAAQRTAGAPSQDQSGQNPGPAQTPATPNPNPSAPNRAYIPMPPEPERAPPWPIRRAQADNAQPWRPAWRPDPNPAAAQSAQPAQQTPSSPADPWAKVHESIDAQVSDFEGYIDQIYGRHALSPRIRPARVADPGTAHDSHAAMTGLDRALAAVAGEPQVHNTDEWSSVQGIRDRSRSLAAAAERRAERDDRKVRRMARVVAKGYNTIGDLVDRIADRLGDEGPVRLEINQALREAADYARATADMLVQVADPSAATSAIDGAGVGRGEIPAKVRRAERRQQLAAEHTGPYRWMSDEQLLTYHRSAAEAVRLAKHAAAEERTRPTVSEQEIEQAVRFLNPQLAADRDSLRATRAFVERAEQGGHKVRHEPGTDPHDRIENAWQHACGEVRAKTAQSSPQAATWDQRAQVAHKELGAISQEIARRSKLSTPQRHADAELRERHQQQLQRRIPGNLAVDHAAAGVHGVTQHLTHAMAAAGGHAGLGTP